MAEPQVDPRVVDETRREIGRLVGEIEQLANQELSPTEFYAETMRRVYTALAARAVALWMRTPQGNLQLQFQVNLPSLNEVERGAHDEMLRFAVTKQDSMLIGPSSGPGTDGLGTTIQNPTPYLLVLAPVLVDNDAVGIVEVFQEGSRRSSAQQGYLQFSKRVAGEIGKFIKNGRYRIILGQQAQWNQIESFIRAIHGGLHPTQVAYLVANEGKRIIQCERLSVAIRRGKKTKIVAISGQDVVESRSNLVRRMTKLVDRILKHGENLIYSGRIEEHWPGDVQSAMQEYLDESPSKLLVIVPMTDNREFADRKGRADTAIVCEMIEDAALPEDMAAKIDVVARHSATALANALEHDDIFLLGLWKGIGRSTRWVRGRGLPKVLLALVLLAVVTGILTFFPYPLRLEGRGELVPEVRRIVYAPVTGRIRSVIVDHGTPVEEGSKLAEMESFELERQEDELRGKLHAVISRLNSLQKEKQRRGGQLDDKLNGEITQAEEEKNGYERQISLVARQKRQLVINSPIPGAIMDWKPKDLLTRPVQQGDPLFKVASVDGKWIVEVDLPENTITHIARAESQSNEPLEVEFVLSATPDKVHKGKLIEYATEARPVEQENFVHAKIELVGDDELVEQSRQTALKAQEEGKVSGLEVRAKVNCGSHSLGYVLFRELIDFIREYVFF